MHIEMFELICVLLLPVLSCFVYLLFMIVIYLKKRYVAKVGSGLKMSGPYTNGLGKRNRKESESSSSDSESSDFFSSHRVKMYKRRRVTPSDAEVIPKFKPEDDSSNVIGWLHKIDQLGDVYGWEDIDRTFIMQLRLRGAAREWYDDLENYDLSWKEWKAMLHTAFPRSTDYVDKLERMMSRRKEDKETMTKYYHDKLSLLKKCDIVGENAISCIIRGLPSELWANARAYNCETPEQLYYGYLSSLENFKRVEAHSARKSTWRRGVNNSTLGVTPQYQLQPKICYTCRRTGHESRDCRQQQRCETCRRSGHTTATCWFAAGTSRQLSQKEFGFKGEERNQDRGARSIQDGRVLTNTHSTK